MVEPNIRLLRYFLAVAEELNVGRAARRLYVSQPALSQQLRRLEHDLGVELFHRSSRGMRLTESGAVLLPVAEEVVRAADRLIATAGARPGRRGLVVGFVGNGLGHLNAAVRDDYARRMPRVDLLLRQVEVQDQLESLRSGQVDVALARLPVRETDLTVVPFFAEPRLVCLPAAHRLAGRCHVDVDALAGEVFLAVPERSPRHWREFWLAQPRPGGAPVRLGPSFGTAEEALQLVAAGHGVLLVAATFRDGYSREELRFVPVRGLAPSRVALAWRGEQPPPGGRELLTTLRSVAARTERGGAAAFAALGCEHGDGAAEHRDGSPGAATGARSA
ncbi:LysR family transcriptional regulator [Dactylosporangium siamense]|uniref:LysR family transcriptional regulator n=1 Tax=Dactylosporangium siamense TaxID=685454 RepID=A0A919U5P8_9ACTN|nr:LysR family transcriptional regulator [Dactylosporangium siamense]GIG42582.1 LysR family transcriptional regulator [Dactylosporangium siamense]